MSIFKPTASTSKQFSIPTAGNVAGALVAILDLGTHDVEYGDDKKGKKLVPTRKVFLAFEIDEMDGDKPHIIGKEYTLTTSPKSGLRKLMEGWRGRAYAEGEAIEVDKALGKPCLVNITHKTAGSGNSYAKLEGVSGMPKGMAAYQPKYTPIIWEIGCGTPFPDEEWLPYSFLHGQLVPLKTILAASNEMKGQTAPPSMNGGAPSAPPVAAGTAPVQAPLGDLEEPLPF